MYKPEFKINYEGKEVSITLTPQQLAQINKELNKAKSYKDITSFEKACEHLSVDITSLNFTNLTCGEIALRKLKIIVKAIRSFTNWKPELSNTNQRKYYPYFDMSSGCFSCRGTTSYYFSTLVASALYLENHEQAKFLGETFVGLFKEYLTAED